MSKRQRISKSDVFNEQFYKMYKFLFEGEFKNLTSDARILYTLLRDRHSLSVANNWVDENNDVFLIYSRENMANMVGCSLPTIRNAVELLKDYGLIEDVRQGLNKPNRIYINKVCVENTRTEKIFQSRNKESLCQDSKNLSPNKTNSIKTDFNKTEYVHLLENTKDDYIYYYINTFKQYMNKEHMRVSIDNFNHIENIVSELKSQGIDNFEWCDAVEEHFKDLPDSNNGNILAFLKASKRYFDIEV